MTCCSTSKSRTSKSSATNQPRDVWRVGVFGAHISHPSEGVPMFQSSIGDSESRTLLHFWASVAHHRLLYSCFFFARKDNENYGHVKRIEKILVSDLFKFIEIKTQLKTPSGRLSPGSPVIIAGLQRYRWLAEPAVSAMEVNMPWPEMCSCLNKTLDLWIGRSFLFELWSEWTP